MYYLSLTAAHLIIELAIHRLPWSLAIRTQHPTHLAHYTIPFLISLPQMQRLSSHRSQKPYKSLFASLVSVSALVFSSILTTRNPASSSVFFVHGSEYEGSFFLAFSTGMLWLEKAKRVAVCMSGAVRYRTIRRRICSSWFERIIG